MSREMGKQMELERFLVYSNINFMGDLNYCFLKDVIRYVYL